MSILQIRINHSGPAVFHGFLACRDRRILNVLKNGRDYRIAREMLTSLRVLTLGGQDIALQSAHNFRLLRKKGITVRKTIDVLIATFCIANNLLLLHSDRDFEPFHLHLKLRSALAG